MPKFGAGREVTREQRDIIRVLFSQQYIHDLNDWEEKFLTNIMREPFLTDKQIAALHKVFDSVTSGKRHQDEYMDTW